MVDRNAVKGVLTDTIQIVSFSCGDETPFKAAAKVHPSMIDPNEAPGI